MKAAVLIDSGEPVKAGDVLEHAPDGTTRPQKGTALTLRSFARVLSPEPVCRAADGSYRVQCEMIIQRPFAPTPERASL